MFTKMGLVNAYTHISIYDLYGAHTHIYTYNNNKEKEATRLKGRA